ncbi:MAG: ribosomal RNA small subunit methyltransferase A [Deferribacteres bacterium]|nr:ribosomal RNA small subunit methyltransferase A [Deferribacteres bacterium]
MKRPLGQHFLFDPNILGRIIDSSGITPEDTVVEIGPGLGTLTRFLSERAGRVIAIEIDRRLIERLRENLAARENVEIITADALSFPYETIEGTFRVVANIPYNITTPLIFRLLQYREKIPSMTLLLQKEVARRIVASAGTREYGALSISVQLYTEPALKFTVSRKAFSPPPEVDSALVHFRVHPAPVFEVKDEALLMKLVKTAFSGRRKMIANSLRAFEGIREALTESGIDPTLRPENLSVADYVRLANALSTVKKQGRP